MKETDPREIQVAQAVAQYIDSQNTGSTDSIAAYCDRHHDLQPELGESLHALSIIDLCLMNEATDAIASAPGFMQSLTNAPPHATSGFELIRKLGSGGMGTVYLAQDTQLGREVAIKWLSDRFLASDALKQRFLDEAHSMAQLNHPNIARIYQLGTSRESPHFIMEFIEGLPINQALQGVDVDRKVRVFRKLLLAIAELHKQGMIHRDLKPENILIDAREEPKVLDFGLVLDLESTHSCAETGLMGTPEYFSPEQTFSGAKLTPQSDIFSLGVLLYELLTETLPFPADSTADQLEAIRSRHPLLPCSIRPQLPGDLQNICLKAMEKQREQRYASVVDMIEDLDCFLNGIKVHAIPSAYSDLMKGKVEKHLLELSQWRSQNLLMETEYQKLQLLYLSTQEREDSWILEMRHLTWTQVGLYFGAWLMIIAQFLVFMFTFEPYGKLYEVVVSSAVPVMTGWLGLRYWRKQQFRLGLAHLLGFGCMLPFSLALLIHHTGAFSTAIPELMDRELFPYFGAVKTITNRELIGALILSIPCMLWIRSHTKSPVMSLLTGIQVAMLCVLFIAQSGLLEWLETDPGKVYLHLIPVAALFYLFAYLVERWRFSEDARYLYPFGFFFTIIALSGIALFHDPLREWMRTAFPFTRGQTEYLFLANALIFWLLQHLFFSIKTPLADVAGKCFRFILPGHVLIALYTLSDSAMKLATNPDNPEAYQFQSETTWLIYLLPVVSSIFVFSSICKQMKNFLISGFIFLFIGCYRLQKYEFHHASFLPVILLFSGFAFMIFSAEHPPLFEWIKSKAGRKS